MFKKIRQYLFSLFNNNPYYLVSIKRNNKDVERMIWDLLKYDFENCSFNYNFNYEYIEMVNNKPYTVTIHIYLKEKIISLMDIGSLSMTYIYMNKRFINNVSIFIANNYLYNRIDNNTKNTIKKTYENNPSLKKANRLNKIKNLRK